jgi:hypothetical protein
VGCTKDEIKTASARIWVRSSIRANAAQSILPIPHHADLFPAPIKIRPHVRAALAAHPAGEALLDIGQPDIIGPAVAADRDRYTSLVEGAEISYEPVPDRRSGKMSAENLRLGSPYPRLIFSAICRNHVRHENVGAHQMIVIASGEAKPADGFVQRV